LLKRYNICFMAAVLGNEYPSNTYKWTLTSRLFPYYAGYAPGAIYSVGGGASYNYVR
jgi:hypothetical protein